MDSHKRASLQRKQANEGVDRWLLAIAVMAGSMALGLFPLIHGTPATLDSAVVPTEASLWLPVGQEPHR